MVVRVRWGAVLVAAFVAVLAAGHAYVMALVLAVQLLAFREITHIALAPSQRKRLPWTRTTKWFFFAVANFFLYGESILTHLQALGRLGLALQPLAERHLFVSYSLYMLGTVHRTAGPAPCAWCTLHASACALPSHSPLVATQRVRPRAYNARRRRPHAQASSFS